MAPTGGSLSSKVETCNSVGALTASQQQSAKNPLRHYHCLLSRRFRPPALSLLSSFAAYGSVSLSFSSSPVSGSGFDPICHWLYDTYLSPGHHISVDLLCIELFYCSCSDQVYNRDFNSTTVLAQSPSFSSTSSSIASPSPKSKRCCVDLKQWCPDPSQSYLICARSTPLHADPSTSDIGSDPAATSLALSSLSHTQVHSWKLSDPLPIELSPVLTAFISLLQTLSV